MPSTVPLKSRAGRSSLQIAPLKLLCNAGKLGARNADDLTNPLFDWRAVFAFDGRCRMWYSCDTDFFLPSAFRKLAAFDSRRLKHLDEVAVCPGSRRQCSWIAIIVRVAEMKKELVGLRRATATEWGETIQRIAFQDTLRRNNSILPHHRNPWANKQK